MGAQAGTTGFYTAVYDILDGDEANPRIQLFETCRNIRVVIGEDLVEAIGDQHAAADPVGLGSGRKIGKKAGARLPEAQAQKAGDAFVTTERLLLALAATG